MQCSGLYGNGQFSCYGQWKLRQTKDDSAVVTRVLLHYSIRKMSLGNKLVLKISIYSFLQICRCLKKSAFQKDAYHPLHTSPAQLHAGMHTPCLPYCILEYTPLPLPAQLHAAIHTTLSPSAWPIVCCDTHHHPHPHPTDRQTGVKTLPSCNLVCGR